MLLSWAHILDEAELLAILSDRGIQLDRDALQQWCASVGSAEEIARRLSAQGGGKAGFTETDLAWVWVAIIVLFALGETQRAEDLFRNWLQEDPRWSWGWIGWADCLLFAPAGQRDLNRAEGNEGNEEDPDQPSQKPRDFRQQE